MQLGVDVQVVHSTLFLEQVASRPEVEVPLCQAYNRWMAEIWEQGGLRDHYDENVAADATRDDLIQDTRLRDFLRGLRAPA